MSWCKQKKKSTIQSTHISKDIECVAFACNIVRNSNPEFCYHQLPREDSEWYPCWQRIGARGQHTYTISQMSEKTVHPKKGLSTWSWHCTQMHKHTQYIYIFSLSRTQVHGQVLFREVKVRLDPGTCDTFFFSISFHANTAIPEKKKTLTSLVCNVLHKECLSDIFIPWKSCEWPWR